MSTQREITRFLAKVPLFQGLNQRQLQKLAKLSQERAYRSKEVIVEQGKIGIGLFIIAKGHVRVVREQAGSAPLELDTLGETDFFGELSLLDDAPRTASVFAVEDTTCLVLTKPEFMNALHKDADMAVAMLQELAGRHRNVMSHL